MIYFRIQIMYFVKSNKSHLDKDGEHYCKANLNYVNKEITMKNAWAFIYNAWAFISKKLNKIYYIKEKKKSCEPFRICLLNSTANPAQFEWKLTGIF